MITLSKLDSRKLVKSSVEKHLNFIIGIEKKLNDLLKELKSIRNYFRNWLLKKYSEQNSEYFMANLDIESLFTNILLEKTIKICCESLCKNQKLLSSISKNRFEKLLRAALCNNYFLFDGLFINKLMGEPLVPQV